MAFFPIFLSIVYVVRNQGHQLERIIQSASEYVLAIGIFKTDVAPGWVSMSLQQSGMFFLISLVLLVLGEYILHMANLSNEGPLYHVGQEFTSAHITRRERLNIEDVSSSVTGDTSSATRVVA